MLTFSQDGNAEEKDGKAANERKARKRARSVRRVKRKREERQQAIDAVKAVHPELVPDDLTYRASLTDPASRKLMEIARRLEMNSKGSGEGPDALSSEHSKGSD